MKRRTTTVLVALAALGSTACETTRAHRDTYRHTEYVVVEQGREVHHHHHDHGAGDGGSTYYVYEVKSPDGTTNVRHHHYDLTAKQQADLNRLRAAKQAEYHGRSVQARQTQSHEHHR